MKLMWRIFALRLPIMIRLQQTLMTKARSPVLLSLLPLCDFYHGHPYVYKRDDVIKSGSLLHTKYVPEFV